MAKAKKQAGNCCSMESVITVDERGQMVSLTPPEQFAKDIREADMIAARMIKEAGIIPQ